MIDKIDLELALSDLRAWKHERCGGDRDGVKRNRPLREETIFTVLLVMEAGMNVFNHIDQERINEAHASSHDGWYQLNIPTNSITQD